MPEIPHKPKNPANHGGGKRANRDNRKNSRRALADDRRTCYDSRSPAEQLAMLVERGHGDCREAKALSLLVHKEDGQ